MIREGAHGFVPGGSTGEFTHSYAAAVKAGLELTGYSAGPPRKPFLPLDTEARAELAQLLRDAGVKVVD